MARTHLPRNAALTGALALALLTSATAAAVAAPVQDPIPIGPNMSFHGLVNGAAVNATIQVGCFGPIVPGQTGHPLAGQSIEADSTPPSTTADGYTGSTGNRLVVTFTASPSSSIIVLGTLSNFYQKVPIPTSVNLPCWGTGQVVFTPQPTSPTARSSAVTVSLVGQP